MRVSTGINDAHHVAQTTCKRLRHFHDAHSGIIDALRTLCPAGQFSHVTIVAVFAAAHPAKRAELNGNWVLVTWVTTQQFITGQNGPDHVLANEEGIRNSDEARQAKHPFSYHDPQQFYWRLMFRHVGNRVQIVSRGEWLRPDGDVEDVTFAGNGDFEFEPDFGAEGDFTYRCRMESATRIVCLFKNGGGEGLQFRKSAD